VNHKNLEFNNNSTTKGKNYEVVYANDDEDSFIDFEFDDIWEDEEEFISMLPSKLRSKLKGKK
jgi:hypothetical protein